MLKKIKKNYENDIVIILCFFFVSRPEKSFRELTEFLKTHQILLHKNTKHIKELLRKNISPELNFHWQANYIGLGSQKMSEEQLNKLLLFFSTQSTKYMSFSILYKQTFFRPKVSTFTHTKNSFLFTPSILHA